MTDPQIADACRIIDRLLWLVSINTSPSNAETAALVWLNNNAPDDVFMSTSTREKMGRLR